MKDDFRLLVKEERISWQNAKVDKLAQVPKLALLEEKVKITKIALRANFGLSRQVKRNFKIC